MKWWLIALVCLGGCFSPINADVVDDGDDVLVEPDPLSDDTSSTVAVSASPDAFAEIAAWMGPANTITVSNAMKVERPEVTLNVPANASVSYEFTGDAGVFTFTNPLPTVTASVLGFHVSPSLKSVTLRPDGSGVASTGLGRRGFRWLAEDEDAGTAAATDSLPEVWAYSQSGCPPCVRSKLELAAAKDLPFRVVWKDEAAPEWLTSRPGFWWHISGAQPSQADVNQTRQASGWNGVRDFVERWKASRTPKRSQRTASAGRLTYNYNASHDCPSCGREQYTIESNEGPVSKSHTHRCNACGTAWYHRDQ